MRLRVPLIILILLFCACSGIAAEQHGVIVEDVAQESAGQRAGIQAGDILISWSFSDAHGLFDSPFDFEEVKQTVRPKGSISIESLRNREKKVFVVAPGDWGVTVRPEMPDPIRQKYQEGPEIWMQIVNEQERTNPSLTLWLLLRIAELQEEAGEIDTLVPIYDRALKLSKQVQSNFIPVWLLVRKGDVLHLLEQDDEALRCYENASAKTDPGTLLKASVTNAMGRLAEDQGNFELSERHYKDAFDVILSVAPESTEAADSMGNVGEMARQKWDFATAEDYFTKSLKIREKVQPNSIPLAEDMHMIGGIRYRRGNLAEAEGSLRSAIALAEKLEPVSMFNAANYNTLGLVLHDRGQLMLAEKAYRKSLEMSEKMAPGTLFITAIYHDLGDLAIDRAEYESAEMYHTKALEIREKLQATGFVSDSYNSLGNLARLRGDPGKAEELLLKSVEIMEKDAPESMDIAVTYRNLAGIELLKSNYSLAQKYAEKSESILKKIAPDSFYVADSIYAMGMILDTQGKFVEAEKKFVEALSIREKATSGSTKEAQILYRLAGLNRRKGNHKIAADYFLRCLQSFESQTSVIGGSEETRSTFDSLYADFYSDSIDFFVQEKKTDVAFRILERYRARNLLSMLAERDLMFADVPADLDRERKELNLEYDGLQKKIANLNLKTEVQRAAGLLTQLKQTRMRQDEIKQKIRENSAHYASLRYPAPIEISEAQSILEPDTTLISYHVAKTQTFLFVLTKDGYKVHTADVNIGTLNSEVERFRSLVSRPVLSAPQTSELIQSGIRLYQLLISPASDDIRKRILIIPDGPLHVLPFAALVQNVKDGIPLYLVQSKPLHVVVSATYYAELQKQRAENQRQNNIVAFGDPDYSPADAKLAKSQDSEIDAILERGYHLEALPASRSEVEAISKMFGDGGTAYLGKEASEEQVKKIGKGTKYLHFACHGILNARTPLDSALVLSLPTNSEQGENGLLQAWEIFEQLRIDSDLVVLSACQTGLGKTLGGEGLVGLTRAFHYAGARSVLSSLWGIADETTSEFMQRFYGYLQSGKSKEQALSSAQIDFIDGEVKLNKDVNPSLPFYWAAFQLSGDWQ